MTTTQSSGLAHRLWHWLLNKTDDAYLYDITGGAEYWRQWLRANPDERTYADRHPSAGEEPAKNRYRRSGSN